LEYDCVCDSEMGNEEIERTISIMQDRKFTDFINCIGSMSFGDNFTWVRNTEDNFCFYSTDDVRKMVPSFLEIYTLP